MKREERKIGNDSGWYQRDKMNEMHFEFAETRPSNGAQMYANQATNRLAQKTCTSSQKCSIWSTINLP